MTTIDALKNLSIAAGCGEATGDTTAEIINHIADNYTSPGPMNLFDINGEVDVNYSGEKQNINSVTDNVITCGVDANARHAAGQMIDTIAGEKYLFKANVLSLGNGAGAMLCCYPYNDAPDEQDVYTNKIGIVEFEYTALLNKTLFGFATSGGTGAQFTDIKVIKI